MFRRSRSAADDGSGQEAAHDSGAESDNGLAKPAAVTASKGRPTPKRSEAERRRRQPYTAPKDRKEAARAGRDRQRAARTRRMEAVRRGEEWALPARDRGPARALARDYVDSKRRISEFYMYGLLVLLVLVLLSRFLPNVAQAINLVILAGVLVMLAEGVFISRRARALVSQRLPGESTRGVGLYAAMRTLQIRKLRVPKPRIKPGDSF